MPASSSAETEAVLENIKADGSFDNLRQRLVGLIKASVRFFDLPCRRPLLPPPSPCLPAQLPDASTSTNTEAVLV